MMPTIRKSIGNSDEVQLLDEPTNQYCLDKINRSHPSDYIELSVEEDHFLIDLWETSTKNVSIPADIFFARTIPLMDCIISVNEESIGGWECKYRVIIFDDYADLIKDTKETDQGVIVGVVYQVIDNPTIPHNRLFFIPIVICPGSDCVCNCNIGYFHKNPTEVFARNKTFEALGQTMVSLLETWYGIQIALLHPAVKDVFVHPQMIREDRVIKPKASGKQKRKVKYIRKHVLTVDNLEKTARPYGDHSINRKCLAWYVVGHWRHYKDGKKIFVMPYWKGALRHMKQNADQIREREIDMHIIND